MKKRKKLVEGTRIVLKANEEEGWARQNAVVIEDNGKVIVVEVAREDKHDDGIREITCDQIEF